MIADTIIRAGEVIPKDIVLYAPPDYSLAFPPLSQETTIILWATEAQAQSGADETDIVVTVTRPSAGAPGVGVFPVEGHVRASDAYGPTGVEFIGKEILPAPADVKIGTGYGENGTEFIGALAGGGSKMKRWTGTEWVTVGTIVVFQ